MLAQSQTKYGAIALRLTQGGPIWRQRRRVTA